MRPIYAMAVIAFTTSGVAQAQNNTAVVDYRTDMFNSCISGIDIGALTKVSDPVRLIGSLVYTGPIMLPDGKVGVGWTKVPLALPITSSESADADVISCRYTFETTANMSIGLFGLNFKALKSDVYKMNVRLLVKQAISPVVENNTSIYPWVSAKYRDQIVSTINATSDTVKDFFLFNDISIYLLQVERYKRTGGAASFSSLFGGAAYQQDESFVGTKVIVTGNPVVLNRAIYVKPLVAAPLVEAIQSLTVVQAKKAEDDVKANATSQPADQTPVAIVPPSPPQIQPSPTTDNPK